MMKHRGVVMFAIRRYRGHYSIRMCDNEVRSLVK